MGLPCARSRLIVGRPHLGRVKDGLGATSGADRAQQVPAAHLSALRQTVHLFDNGVGIDTVVAIEIANRAGLAEMFDPHRDRLMTGDSAQPGQRRRMTVDDGDDFAVTRKVGHQGLDMRLRRFVAAGPGTLGRSPAGVQPVSRRHGQHPNIPAALPDDPRGLDRLGGNGPLIGDDDLTIRPGWRNQ